MLAQGSRRPRTLALAGLVVLAAGALTAQACQKVPLLAPSGSTITLVASGNALGADGSIEITAVVIEGAFGASTGDTVTGGGQPVHNGTLVTFTSSIGRLEPAEAKTTGGRATVKLFGDGRSGTATITAFSGAATESMDVPVGGAAVDRVAVTATPQSLPSTGGSATIEARIEDAGGNGLGSVAVSFQTTAGTLSAASARSNAEGVATTVLTTTQAADVTASVGAKTGTVKIAIRPRVSVAIGLPTTAPVVAVPAGITFTPADGAALANVLVDFGDGGSTELGGITTATAVPYMFRSPGIKTITARATAVDGTVGVSSSQVAVAPLALTVTPSSAAPAIKTLVIFTATPSAGAIIDRYEWNYGNGQTATTASNIGQMVYQLAGQNLVTVRAVPINGGTAASAQVLINVQ